MPAHRNRKAARPSLAALVEATQAELAATARALREHAGRLAGLRRQLRAAIPRRRFDHAVETNQHTLATAMAAGLDAHLADDLVPAISNFEASARASEGDPAPLPEPPELVLVGVLGANDALVAALAPSLGQDSRSPKPVSGFRKDTRCPHPPQP